MTESPRPEPLPHQEFVFARVPAWLQRASPEQRRHLHRLALEADAARQRLKLTQGNMPSLRVQALELLHAELANVLGPSVDPERAVIYWTDPNGQRPPSRRSLLESALLNFHARDTQASAYGEASGLFAQSESTGQPPGDQRLALSPDAFARRCRALDIGERYRQRLMAAMPANLPGRQTPLNSEPPLCWQVYEAQRSSFQIDAYVARLKGRLSSAGEKLLAHWRLASGEGRPAQACRLELFDYPLAGPLVFQPAGAAPGGPAIAYLPSMPEDRVVEHANAQALARALGARLSAPQALKRFAAFVPPARRLEFVERVSRERSNEGWLTSHLRWTPVQITQDPFVEGYRIWAQQTLAQAAEVAVPTALLDHRDTMARYAHWVALGEQIGMDFAMLVGSAIPGANLLVDAIMLAQGLYSLYEGVEAWRAGDSQAALDYLFGAVENVSFLALGKRPEPSPDARAFADQLVPVVGADGQVRLWRPDPDDYRALEQPPSGTLPDGAGRYHHRGRSWVKIEGRYHELGPGGSALHATLAIAPDTRFAPALHGNGNGGWRLAHENPLDWTSAQLVRRFSAEYERLPDTELELAQRLAGISDGQLRQAHLDNEAAPAPLAFLLRRRLLERDLDAVAQSLRGDRCVANAPPAVVETLLHTPGWPVERAIAYEHGGRQYLFGASEDVSPIRLNEAHMHEGRWAAEVLLQLGVEAVDQLLGESTSLVPPEPVKQMLAEHWADFLRRERDDLVAGWLRQAASQSTAQDPGRRTLRRHFPGLVDEAVDALLRHPTDAQRLALAAGRVPVGIAELAAESLRQLRLANACDDIAHGRVSADRERITFALWSRLTPATGQMRVELRAGTPGGELLAHSGAADAPRWVIVRRGRAYQALDDRGLELSAFTGLEQALYATVPDADRASFIQRVGNAAGIRQQLLELALADRKGLRSLLGMVADRRAFFRAPTRHAQGALGYELSGRARSLETPFGAISPMFRALRILYPDIPHAELMEVRASLGHGEAGTAALARLNAELATLAAKPWIRSSPP